MSVQQDFFSLNPWYYWLNYLNQVYSPSLPPVADSPSDTVQHQPTVVTCIAEPYCLDGEILNTTTCKCELLNTPAKSDTTPPPASSPTNATASCSITECPHGQSLDDINCECVCSYNVRCSGLRRFNITSCKCECTHPYPCKHTEQFNTVLCVCIPTVPPARPRPIITRPTPTPPTIQLPPIFIPVQQPILCRSVQCSGYKVFDMSRCGCYCPLNSAVTRRCNAGKVFNTDTCQCECPSGIPGVPRCANRLHYFDENDCSCKCRVLNSVCNNDLQIFNPNTCQCQCQRVYLTIGGQNRNGHIIQYKRSLQLTQGTAKQQRARHVKRRRMTRTHTRTRHRGRTGSPHHHRHLTTPPQVVQPQQVIPTHTIIAYSCPLGTTTDQNTCYCI